MEKQAALNRLQNEVNALIQTVENISEEHFFQQPSSEKWSIGQNIQHLIQSSKPLVKLFGKPELMEQWAKNNRSSESYAGIKSMYINALKTPPPFLSVYKPIDTEGSQKDILDNFKSITAALLERAARISETDLDIYQIPHPLLGLLTAGDFLHFTAFHTLHHHEIIQKIKIHIS